MDRVSRVRPRQLPLRSPSARIGFPRSEEWFKPPGAIRREGWSVYWDKCGAGPGCFHLIAGEVRGLARGDAAASGVSESPWDDKVESTVGAKSACHSTVHKTNSGHRYAPPCHQRWVLEISR